MDTSLIIALVIAVCWLWINHKLKDYGKTKKEVNKPITNAVAVSSIAEPATLCTKHRE